MATDILMPALSPTMEEGTLAKWLVKEGDTVESGQILAEIETDKATMEFEAVDEGLVGKLLVPEGTEGISVNTPIAILVAESEDLANSVEPKTPELPLEPKSIFEPPPPPSQPAAARSAPEPDLPWIPNSGSKQYGKRCAMPWPRR